MAKVHKKLFCSGEKIPSTVEGDEGHADSHDGHQGLQSNVVLERLDGQALHQSQVIVGLQRSVLLVTILFVTIITIIFFLIIFISSVRSSNSHPDLLLTQHHHPPTFSDHTGPQHWTYTF